MGFVSLSSLNTEISEREEQRKQGVGGLRKEKKKTRGTNIGQKMYCHLIFSSKVNKHFFPKGLGNSFAD